MSTPRRHHFVSRAYLERFARDGRVRVRRRDRQESFVASTEKVAVQTDFYGLPDQDDGDEGAYVERVLSGIDEEAINCLRRMDIRTDPLEMDSGDRRALAGVIGLQLTRTPEQRERLMFPLKFAEYAKHRKITHSLMAEFLEHQHLGFRPDEREVSAALEYVKVFLSDHVALDRQFALRTMFETADVLAAHLLSMHWQLEVARKPRLITSDLPVVLWRPPSERDRYEGLGIQNAHEIRFPLDPGKQLVLTHEPTAQTRSIEPDRVRSCNADMGLACHQFVIGHADRPNDLHRFTLPERRPVIRFNKGPLYLKDENGKPRRQEGSEVLHMWVPRR